MKRLIALLAIASYLIAPLALADIVKDANGTSGQQTGVTTFSTILTVSSTADLVVCGVANGANTNAASTYSFGGQDMTLAIRANANTADTELWYLVNPPTGLQHATTTMSGTATGNAGCVSWIGANSSTPLENIASTTSAGSLTLTLNLAATTATDSVMSAAVWNATLARSASANAGETTFFNSASISKGGIGGWKGYVPAGNTTTTSYTASGGTPLNDLVGIELLSASTTAPASPAPVAYVTVESDDW